MVNLDKDIVEDIWEIVRLTPEEIRIGNSRASESLQLLRGLASTDGRCITIYVNDRVLPIFIEARDNNDIFLEKEY